LAKDDDILNGLNQSIQTYISSELIPRIQSSRYSSFVRDTPQLVFGTGPAISGQAPNIKVPSTSYPTFGALDILDIKDLIPFLSRTTTGSKEVYIIHLISEVEIERPKTTSYDSEDKIDKKGKQKGKKARSVSATNSIPEPKRVRLQALGVKVSLLFMYKSILTYLRSLALKILLRRSLVLMILLKR
jgi:hypothetical protein